MRKAMSEAGMARIERLYHWKIVIKKWIDLLEESQKMRLAAIHDDETLKNGKLPPWLPPCSTSFGCFASEVLPKEWRPTATPEPLSEEEKHSSILQNWDTDLLQKHNARRMGWWIKSGLVEQ